MPETPETPATLTLPLDTLAIRKILPHRYPFLLVDRVIELDPGKSIVAYKNLTANEPFFQGHFPDYPVMPGVLQIEALAQTGAILALSMPGNEGKAALLTGVDGFKFRRQVVPGDQLRLEVTVTRYRMGFGKAAARATVDGELTAEGEISFAAAKL
jgi:3-hydroxyacyl-[acyl-carrier-protein] dehydratase